LFVDDHTVYATLLNEDDGETITVVEMLQCKSLISVVKC